jgi:hypothetical protein
MHFHQIKKVVATEKLAFGNHREGNINFLLLNGIEVLVLPLKKYQGRIISST